MAITLPGYVVRGLYRDNPEIEQSDIDFIIRHLSPYAGSAKDLEQLAESATEFLIPDNVGNVRELINDEEFMEYLSIYRQGGIRNYGFVLNGMLNFIAPAAAKNGKHHPGMIAKAVSRDVLVEITKQEFPPHDMPEGLGKWVYVARVPYSAVFHAKDSEGSAEPEKEARYETVTDFVYNPNLAAAAANNKKEIFKSIMLSLVFETMEGLTEDRVLDLTSLYAEDMVAKRLEQFYDEFRDDDLLHVPLTAVSLIWKEEGRQKAIETAESGYRKNLERLERQKATAQSK